MPADSREGHAGQSPPEPRGQRPYVFHSPWLEPSQVLGTQKALVKYLLNNMNDDIMCFRALVTYCSITNDLQVQWLKTFTIFQFLPSRKSSGSPGSSGPGSLTGPQSSQGSSGRNPLSSLFTWLLSGLSSSQAVGLRPHSLSWPCGSLCRASHYVEACSITARKWEEIMQVASPHFGPIVLARNKLLGPAYEQGEGISQGNDYQEIRIIEPF